MADRETRELDPLALDIDAYMAGLEGDHDDPGLDDAVETPANEADANVLLRRIRYYERELDRLGELRRAEHQRADAFYDDRSAAPRRAIARNAAALEGWMRGVHELNPKIKTRKLPLGEAAIRAGRSRVQVGSPVRVEMWTDSANVDGFVEKVPKVSAEAVNQWCLPGAPLGEADEDGYRETEAVFVPALVANALHAAWSGVPRGLPVVVPGVSFLVPTRSNFTYRTAKPQPAAQQEDPGS